MKTRRQLPLPDVSFDRVVSSLVLHHLTRDGRRRTASGALVRLRARPQLPGPHGGSSSPGPRGAGTEVGG